MIKEAFFDADEVLIVNRPKKFSERLVEEYGIPSEKVSPFFQNEFKLCVVGRGDLYEAVGRQLKSWGWTGTVDDLFRCWVVPESQIDHRLLGTIDALRKSGIKCYMVTDQEKYRAQYIMDALELDKHFDGVFFSYELGCRKEEDGFFKQVLHKLDDILPAEAIYWDDDEINIQAARSYGIDARLYTTYDIFLTEIEELKLIK